MNIINIINLLGGLGLFLFGMNYMSDGINQVAGSKMKDLLEKLTRNKFKGFLVGVFVTGIIQSSSATTVMLMGFLNAGIMDLAQATGVILGAHIGTTITAVLIAIDVSAISTVCIFLGAVLVLFSKKTAHKYIGQIILGFGILFFGLKYMSGDSAMGVLKSSAAFKTFISHANNPLIGIGVGTLMCAILQSSSASIGVLQVLALQGLMPLNFAIYLIIGVNVGSAMPLFISSIGAKTNAKRAALIYFIFDIVGMLIFTPVALFTPYTSFITSLTANGSIQVAIAHIIFKTATAFFLLPFVDTLVKYIEKAIPSKAHETELRFLYIDEKLNDPISLVPQIKSELERYISLVRSNFTASCQAFVNKDISEKDKIMHNEELINWLHNHITDFIITITNRPLSNENSAFIGRMFHVLIDLERIGDYAIDILSKTEQTIDEQLSFSNESIEEFKTVYENVLVLFNESIHVLKQDKLYEQEKLGLKNINKFIKELNAKALDKHIARLRTHECHTESGVIFTKLLQDLERAADHSFNISKAGKDDSEVISRM
ncbi:Na/Pi cotransporter family protein [Eggerthia catenaformis]|uniref:Na/Pi cotransporter family protein n=1 Tax=Eggerthia catenaformis TaxID=31973 RepID=UPI00248D7E2F|nr:Na/Pi cotransporter family protein [Eggerthia catenaformis]